MTADTISGTSMQAPSQLLSPFPSSFSFRQVLPGATRQGHAMQRPKEHADLSLSGFLLSPLHLQDTSSSTGSTHHFGFSSTSNASSSVGEGVSSMESKLLSSSQMQTSSSSPSSSSAPSASALASSKLKPKSNLKSKLPSSEAGMTIDIANLKVSGTVTDILINQFFPAHLFTSYLPHYTESVEFSRFCWIPPPCLTIW